MGAIVKPKRIILMEITIQVIACYLLFLLIQALFINGIKAASNGETEISPSGRVIDGEMILYPLYKFIMQHTIRKDYYGIWFWEKIGEAIPNKTPEIPLTREEWIKFAKTVQAYFGNEIKYEFQKNQIEFYKEYK